MRKPIKPTPNVDANRRLVRTMFVLLVLIVLSGGIYFARQSGTNAEVYRNDFNVYYQAAKEIRSGHDPYAKSLGDWTPYIYPPLLAEALVPLTMLALPVAAYLWFLISAGSMVAAACMSAGLAVKNDQNNAPFGRLPSLSAIVGGLAVIIVVRFALDTFNLGQVNTIVAALAVAHVYLYARDRKALSAIALVVAISIKLTPALLIVYHIAKLRLKFAALCIAITIGVTVMSFLPFGAHAVDAAKAFATRTLENGQGYNLADPGNQSLRGTLARLARGNEERAEDARSPVDAEILVAAIVLLALAVLAAHRALNEAAGIAPFFCCLVLLCPLSWKAHYVILILPIACLGSAVFNSETATGARRSALSAIIAAFVLFNLTSPRVVGLATAEWADAHSLVTLGATLVFATSLALNLAKFGKQPRVC